MKQGTGGNAAYSNLRRLENPVMDSMKTFGGILSKRTDDLRKENIKAKEDLIKEHQDWASKNGLTNDMFEIMVTENPDFNKQSTAYANQSRQKYLEIMDNANKAMRSGNFKDKEKYTAQMRNIVGGFDQISKIGEVVKTKGEEFKTILKSDDYDKVLNGTLEDMFASVLDNKNAAFAMHSETFMPQLAFPSRDGGVRVAPITSLVTGKALEYIPNVNGTEALNNVVGTIKKNEIIRMNGLNKETKIEWDQAKQELTEKLLYSSFNNNQFKNLYRKFVNPDHTDGSIELTEEQKRETIKVMAQNAQEMFEREDKSEMDSAAVSLQNNKETVKASISNNIRTTNASLETNRNTVNASVRNTDANIAQKDKELDFKKKVDARENEAVFSTTSTIHNGVKKNIVEIGLPIKITVGADKDGKAIEVSSIQSIKLKNGNYEYRALDPYTNKYVTVQNVGTVFKSAGLEVDETMKKIRQKEQSK